MLVALWDFFTFDLTAVLVMVSRSLICQFPMIGDFGSDQNPRFANSDSEIHKNVCNLSFISPIHEIRSYP